MTFSTRSPSLIARDVLLLLVGAYMVLPTMFVFWLSFSVDDVLRFPPRLFSLRWYEEFLTNEAWQDAVSRTVVVGTLATVIAVVIGTAAAFAVARSDLRARQLVEAVAIAPLVVPPIVIAAGGYSLYLDLRLVGSIPGLAIMHTVLGMPYVYLIVSAGLSRSDPHVELAALSLGAPRWKVIRDVTIPILVPSIVTGGLFAFLVSFDEVVITVLLSGSLGPTLPVKIFASLSLAVSPVVAAVSTLQIIVTLVLLAQLALVRYWQSSRSYSTATLEPA